MPATVYNTFPILVKQPHRDEPLAVVATTPHLSISIDKEQNSRFHLRDVPLMRKCDLHRIIQYIFTPTAMPASRIAPRLKAHFEIGVEIDIRNECQVVVLVAEATHRPTMFACGMVGIWYDCETKRCHG